MMASRSFLVHHNGSDFEVNYHSDYGLQGFKDELFHRMGIPPSEQKIMGADDDRIISCDSDLVAVISGKLRLVSTSGNDGFQDFARTLQEREMEPYDGELNLLQRGHLTPAVKDEHLRALTLSIDVHSQPLELEKYRVYVPDGSGTDTIGHGMAVAPPSEILYERYGDKIHGEITNFLQNSLLPEGPGVEHIKELKRFRQDRCRYIYSLVSICFCDDLKNDIRDLAGLCLKNELWDADDLVEPCVMDFIKTKSLAIISSPSDSVPRSTFQVIFELARIAGKKFEEWPELIELIECSLHKKQLLTPAVLETFGYISVLRWLGRRTVRKLFKVLVCGMNLKNNDSVCLAATKAMCYALSIVQANLRGRMGKILKAILEAAGSSNLNIKQAAFQCLIVLPSRFYNHLGEYPCLLEKIMAFTAVALKEGKKDDAFGAIEFWSSLCEAKIDILKKIYWIGGSYRFYNLIKLNSKDLIHLLLPLFDIEEIERASEFDRALDMEEVERAIEFDRALCLCVGYIAETVIEDYKSFTSAVELFVDTNDTAGDKYLVKVIYSTMGVVADIFGEEEEAGKEGKEPEKKKKLGRWEGLLLTHMKKIIEKLLKRDREFLHKTMKETISRYPHQDSISDPTALMKGVCAKYFESSAFSYLREAHGEDLLGTFRKSWGTHLSMIQLLRLFFSLHDCHSKDLETWVLSPVFPKITDAVTEVIDLASNEDKQFDKNLVESVTNVLMAHGIGRTNAADIDGASARCAESIAMFCENLLKKDVSDEEMEKQLNMVSVVSKFYIDIGYFIDFYIKRVGSRIHHVDLEQESRMLKMVWKTLFDGEEKYSSSLKNLEHGVNFLVSGQNEDKQKFEEYVVNKSIKDGGMVMNLATVGPHSSLKDTSFENIILPQEIFGSIKLPQELVNMAGVATEFFKNTPVRGRPRKFVQMIHSLCRCTVVGKFGTERIELDMDTAQATLLMLYNTADTWIFSEILTELRISKEELVSLIHSLSQENNKLLIKVPSTEDILQTDCFELNTNFTYTSPIPRPVLEDSGRIAVERVDNVMISCTIRCVIMKIIKPNKGLRPMDKEKLADAAIEKCAGLEKCGFVPTRADVDDSIASLIKDEYLREDKNDNNKLWWNEE